jgi:hypothetical protein
METRRDIAFDKSIAFLHFLLALPDIHYDWDREKQKLHGKIAGKDWSFRLPLSYPLADAKIGFQAYLNLVPDVPSPYVLILIQAGHSAFAFFEDGKMLHHKVIKKYMVRGNGKAQVGYLQSRGKSKAGSRIRLANTITFFEDINAKLTEWECVDASARILVSCPIALQSHWFQSQVPPPFAKDDPRILKVPIDVQQPGLEELGKVNQTILRGRWEGPAAIVDAFFAQLRLPNA